MNITSTILILFSTCILSEAYSPTMGFITKRSTMTMKRGRGSFQKELGSTGNNSGPRRSSTAGSNINWINTNQKVSVLPTEEGKVGLLDTGAFLLKDKATNPTGAVAVMKYESQTYCFSSSCPQCKIPLTKAKAYPPNEESSSGPRISCDFCKATYSLSTGQKVTSEGNAGFLGGIAKAVMSAQENGDLPIYKLGEKNGKVLFNMD